MSKNQSIDQCPFVVAAQEPSGVWLKFTGTMKTEDEAQGWIDSASFPIKINFRVVDLRKEKISDECEQTGQKNYKEGPEEEENWPESYLAEYLRAGGYSSNPDVRRRS